MPLIKKLFLSFSISLLILIYSPTAVWGSYNELKCEEVKIEKKLYSCEFDVQELEENIQEYIDEGVKKTKAVGNVGEDYARDVIENSKENGINFFSVNAVSIVTLFKDKDCTLNGVLQNGSGHGLDDIFVVRGKDGWIDRDTTPVFHEAKYSGQCKASLSTTKTICKQLSFQWIDSHLNEMNKRVAQAKIKFLDKKDALIVETPYNTKCAGKLKEAVEWLKVHLTGYDFAGKRGEISFYRTASVLCPDGTFKLYQVVKKKKD